MAAFKVGDRVTWSSQAGGSTKTKAGKVLCVIPGGKKSGETAQRFFNQRAGTHITSAFGGGWDRPETSYIVEVREGKTNKAKPKLYWPRANTLQPA